jgi:hypothetical protein
MGQRLLAQTMLRSKATHIPRQNVPQRSLVSLFHHKADFGLITLLRRPLLSYIRLRCAICPAPMEFRFQYLTAMREQNPKLMRRLEKSGQLDRLVNLKAGEASRLYQQIVAGKPKTLQNEREAEEQVNGMMFEFPYDMDDVPEGRNALLNEKPLAD